MIWINLPRSVNCHLKDLKYGLSLFMLLFLGIFSVGCSLLEYTKINDPESLKLLKPEEVKGVPFIQAYLFCHGANQSPSLYVDNYGTIWLHTRCESREQLVQYSKNGLENNLIQGIHANFNQERERITKTLKKVDLKRESPQKFGTGGLVYSGYSIAPYYYIVLNIEGSDLFLEFADYTQKVSIYKRALSGDTQSRDVILSGYINVPVSHLRAFLSSFIENRLSRGESIDTTLIERIGLKETFVVLQAKVEFNEIRKTESIEKYESFLRRFGDTEYAAEVKKRLQELTFEQAKRENTIDAYRAFIARFPESPQKAEALRKLEELSFERASKLNTIDAYKSFIAEFPNSRYAERAKQKILDLETDKSYETVRRADSALAFHDFISKMPPQYYRANEVKETYSKALTSAFLFDCKVNFIGKRKEEIRWFGFGSKTGERHLRDYVVNCSVALSHDVARAIGVPDTLKLEAELPFKQSFIHGQGGLFLGSAAQKDEIMLSTKKTVELIKGRANVDFPLTIEQVMLHVFLIRRGVEAKATDDLTIFTPKVLSLDMADQLTRDTFGKLRVSTLASRYYQRKLFQVSLLDESREIALRIAREVDRTYSEVPSYSYSPNQEQRKKTYGRLADYEVKFSSGTSWTVFVEGVGDHCVLRHDVPLAFDEHIADLPTCKPSIQQIHDVIVNSKYYRNSKPGTIISIRKR